jgi:hypothetical protein
MGEGRMERSGARPQDQTQVLTLTGFMRYSILFVMEYKTRRVKIASIVHLPYEAWMKQIARNLTDCFDGFLLKQSTSFTIATRYLPRRFYRC